MEEAKSELLNYQQVINYEREATESELKLLQTQVVTASDKFQSQLQSLQSNFDELISVLSTRKSQSLSSAQTESEARNTFIHHAQQQLTEFQPKIEQLRVSCDAALAITEEAELLKQQQQVSQSLAALKLEFQVAISQAKRVTTLVGEGLTRPLALPDLKKQISKFAGLNAFQTANFEFTLEVKREQPKRILGSKQAKSSSSHQSSSNSSAQQTHHPAIYFTLPWGVAFDYNGRRTIVTQLNQHLAQVFDYYGNFIFNLGGPGNGAGCFDHPRGVCVQAGTDNIVVTSDGRVQLFNPQGEYIGAAEPLASADGSEAKAELPQMSSPIGVCSTKSGELLVADSEAHGVHWFDASGKFLRFFGSEGAEYEQLDDPFDVAFDLFGRLLVADSNNNRVSIWSADGRQCLQHIAVPAPRGVCVDHQGCIIVSSGSHIVRVFDPYQGKLLQQIGTEDVHDEAAGHFFYPTGVTVDANNALYVADHQNHRVQIF